MSAEHDDQRTHRIVTADACVMPVQGKRSEKETDEEPCMTQNTIHPHPEGENAHTQVYNTILKRLVENQASAVIPLLLGPLAPTVLGEVSVEVPLQPRRTVRAYKTRSRAGWVVLNLECETSARTNIDIRLLVHHALLLDKYGLPVTSVALFPFAPAPVTPPLVELHGTKEILRFVYHTVCLPDLDARTFVEQHAIPVYGLLPAMGQTSDDLLLHCLDEIEKYYRKDEKLLRDQIVCFKVLLQQTRPGVSLDHVLKKIRMLDSL